MFMRKKMYIVLFHIDLYNKIRIWYGYTDELSEYDGRISESESLSCFNQFIRAENLIPRRERWGVLIMFTRISFKI